MDIEENLVIECNNLTQLFYFIKQIMKIIGNDNMIRTRLFGKIVEAFKEDKYERWVIIIKDLNTIDLLLIGSMTNYTIPKGFKFINGDVLARDLKIKSLIYK